MSRELSQEAKKQVQQVLDYLHKSESKVMTSLDELLCFIPVLKSCEKEIIKIKEKELKKLIMESTPNLPGI